MHLDHQTDESIAPRDGGVTDEGIVTVDEERRELERVLNHPPINRSVNLVRFLQFVCGKYFEGHAEEIRERTVAVEALGRRESSFDSHSDPIVRVTARELRKKLGEYYASEGSGHTVQIVLPLGRYIPQFTRRVCGENAELSTCEEPQESQSPSGVGPDGAVLANQSTAEEPVQSQGLPRSKWLKGAAACLIVGCAFAAGFFVGRHHAVTRTIGVPILWGAPEWSDEFDGAAQTPPSSANWTDDDAQPGAPGSPCGSGAACVHAARNAFLDGEGHLILRASRNPNGSWSTAKLSTRGLHNFQYGRIEARMRLPVGAGLWSAFWMMGASFPKVGWPAAGSVDIMENVTPQQSEDGLGPNVIRSTLHGPAYFGQAGLWKDYKLPSQQRVDGSFHTYGIIWSPQRLQFYVDDPSNIFFEKDASEVPRGTQWIYDQPFYLVMNLAVGGDWPGSADNTTPNPADIIVDYVRVYHLPDVLTKETR